MVQFLLDNGMGVNTTFGQCQTYVPPRRSLCLSMYVNNICHRSYIQWALDKKQFEVARCLLRNKADVNYVSLLGWNALFYCWPKAGAGMEISTEEVEFLSKHDYLDVDLVDSWGWTVLHRLAAYGSAIDVRKLIQLGASTSHLRMPLGWSAIFHSAHWGNLGTFVELLKYHPEDIIHAEDARGWTLLHVAASAGREEICRLLLGLGANHRAVSRSSSICMRKSIHGLCCTPSDVAAAQNPAHLRMFGDLLAEFCLDEDTEGESEFVDAWEKMPLLEEMSHQEKVPIL
jgi:ankyrin repeat protein